MSTVLNQINSQFLLYIIQYFIQITFFFIFFPISNTIAIQFQVNNIFIQFHFIMQ